MRIVRGRQLRSFEQDKMLIRCVWGCAVNMAVSESCDDDLRDTLVVTGSFMPKSCVPKLFADRLTAV